MIKKEDVLKKYMVKIDLDILSLILKIYMI